MKLLITLFAASLFSLTVCAQELDYNLKKGYAAEGYDVVSYFDGKPMEGEKDYSTTHDGVKYKFSSQANLDKFKAEPEAYVPQYGGYCAYAIAVNDKKVSIDPETFEIRDGKLYLFYNSFGVNTLEKWLEENPGQLLPKAEQNWEHLKHK